MSKEKKKRSGIGLALWIVLTLMVFIMFLVFQDRIFTNLKTTDFFNRMFGKTPAFVEKIEPKEPDRSVEKNNVEPMAPVEINIFGDETADSGVVPKSSAAREQIKETAIAQANQFAQESASKQEKQNEKRETAVTKSELKTGKNDKPKEPEKLVVEKPAEMTLRLFFMCINSDGSISRREVSRTMAKNDSPLTAAVNALIAGPLPAEEKIGCRSLVSNGTRLIGASVRNGVATLNFSGEFEFNQYGIEGTRGQLQQIVYTATAFPTVESVQFLVDGEKKDYLGSEGVWIGTPLSRSSF